MAKFSIILKISESKVTKALDSIKNHYANAEQSQYGKKDSELLYLLKISTSDTKEIIENKLKEIPGISNISVNDEPGMISKLPKKFSTWLMLGLIVGWLIISYIAFFTSNNFIDTLSQSQLLVIQISIALFISIWIFLYDRRTQQNVIDVLAAIDLRTSEINENVKDLDNKDST